MKIGIIGAGQIGSTLTRRLRGLRHEVHVANSKSLGELGFDAIDAGGLDDSWRQQPGTPVYTTDLNAEGLRKALSAAHRERTRDWTATLKKPRQFRHSRIMDCGQRRHATIDPYHIVYQLHKFRPDERQAESS